MDRLLVIEAFVRVAETRSFAEAVVGAPLFVRNTRSVRLSELSQTLLQECAELVVRTDEVVNQMREVTTSPVGRLRVHAIQRASAWSFMAPMCRPNRSNSSPHC